MHEGKLPVRTNLFTELTRFVSPCQNVGSFCTISLIAAVSFAAGSGIASFCSASLLTLSAAHGATSKSLMRATDTL